MGVGGQHHTPATLPPGKTWYPLHRRLGGPQGQFGWVQKISPPPEFDPQTIQPVVSRYTNYTFLAYFLNCMHCKFQLPMCKILWFAAYLWITALKWVPPPPSTASHFTVSLLITIQFVHLA